MFYNIAIEFKDTSLTKILSIVPEGEMIKLVDAYEIGKDSIRINGEIIYIKNPYRFKIYDTSKIEKNTTSGLTHRLKEYLYINSMDEIDESDFNYFGLDVTSAYIKCEWGDKIPDDEYVIPINNIKYYIELSRINEIRLLQNKNFDLTKLIRLCEETNEACNYKLYFATAALVRSIIDHVPPIFEMKKFSEVANNYNAKGRSASFKASMEHLESSMRKISDRIVHSHVTSKETLPNETQIDCKRDLDVLLEEVVRILK